VVIEGVSVRALGSRLCGWQCLCRDCVLSPHFRARFGPLWRVACPVSGPCSHGPYLASANL